MTSAFYEPEIRVGERCLKRDAPDDFGNEFIPYVVKCTDNYGNMIVHWQFSRELILAREHYFRS